MSKKILIDAFFNQFSDFLTELTKAFPEDQDFPAYKAGLQLLKRTNPMIVINAIIEHVTPYEEMIKTKNSDFFLKHEFSEHTGDDDALQQVIRKLKGLWTTLGPSSQASVWGYINLLLDLAKRCAA